MTDADPDDADFILPHPNCLRPKHPPPPDAQDFPECRPRGLPAAFVSSRAPSCVFRRRLDPRLAAQYTTKFITL